MCGKLVHSLGQDNMLQTYVTCLLNLFLGIILLIHHILTSAAKATCSSIKGSSPMICDNWVYDISKDDAECAGEECNPGDKTTCCKRMSLSAVLIL